MECWKSGKDLSGFIPCLCNLMFDVCRDVWTETHTPLPGASSVSVTTSPLCRELCLVRISSLPEHSTLVVSDVGRHFSVPLLHYSSVQDKDNTLDLFHGPFGRPSVSPFNWLPRLYPKAKILSTPSLSLFPGLHTLNPHFNLDPKKTSKFKKEITPYCFYVI